MKTFTVTIRDNRTRSTVIPGKIKTFAGAIRKVLNGEHVYYE